MKISSTYICYVLEDDIITNLLLSILCWHCCFEIEEIFSRSNKTKYQLHLRYVALVSKVSLSRHMENVALVTTFFSAPQHIIG